MKPRQFELPATAGVFNLAGLSTADGDRLMREARENEERRSAAREFEATMQRKLAECPGVVGFDAPSSLGSRGRVVVEPAHACEAREWLGRRFHVNESVEVDRASGLVFEVQPRQRRAGQRRMKVTWKVEQFTLPI